MAADMRYRVRLNPGMHMPNTLHSEKVAALLACLFAASDEKDPALLARIKHEADAKHGGNRYAPELMPLFDGEAPVLGRFADDDEPPAVAAFARGEERMRGPHTLVFSNCRNFAVRVPGSGFRENRPLPLRAAENRIVLPTVEPTTATAAPSRANSSAPALPMPDAAAVMTASLPLSLMLSTLVSGQLVV